MTPRAKVQTLPGQTANVPRIARNSIFPSQRAVIRDYPGAEEAIFHAMSESLAYGFHYTLLESYDVSSIDPLTDRMMATHVGRCFWTWEDVPVQPASLKRLAMRRSGALPSDMQEVSPRLAAEMMVCAPTALGRMLHGFKAEQAMGLMGYGTVQDGRLPILQRLPKQTKRTGYSVRQSYLLSIAGDVLPFAAVVAQHTLYPESLGRTLKDLRDVIVADALKVFDAAGCPIDKDWAETMYYGACDALMTQKWDLELSAEPDESDLAKVMQRLLIQRNKAKLKFPAEALYRLGELTGISPAAFVRYAIKDQQRRGTTYVTAEQVLVLSELCQGLLADELAALAELLQPQGDPRHAIILDVLEKVTGWHEIAPEWGVGRPIHTKRLSA